ncbi:glycoside hydrolase family 43 protein [Marinimicrobium sp. ABcell2]|uniref:glycoside hydrolase family 43 protein n=1 Tax=Marinimicrobium sp. ABcell2 TaxID=3069751 RepID=UPI0027B08C67|nr:glycoside hydrolase family 43 protein [Marinimicrobium sp. ABcell2]MDQ2077090.1 glycoside hydrolase family 43 protein [Marinimicrobium sp. ABcell2]
MKRQHTLFLASALSFSLALVGCGSSSSGDNGNDKEPNGDPPPNAPPGISFNNISVHDPSVIKVDDAYYVFGSHMSAARTTDLMNWTRVANDVNSANPLFEDVMVELDELFEWTRGPSMWAADVTQLGDGRFYFYYNGSQGDRPRGALGLAIADNVEGPYEDQGIFIWSGMENTEENELYHPTGGTFNANYEPHAIDPHTFYDKDGELWMVYGSYSGGIFVLEMNEETGLPKPDQGYGTHVWGGYHARIEGPYMIYSEETDYYYLLMTYGGLDSTGGYEQRVARARNPDGPFVDGRGTDMSDVRGEPNCGLDCADSLITPHGQKLMGSFLFDRRDGEPGFGSGHGYVSPGHNSAYYKADSDQYFLFFHTRFPSRGEQHEVRVHEMFINEDDWLVVAPHRYVPLSEAEADLSWSIAEDEAVGTYMFMEHSLPLLRGYRESDRITLEADGSITGELSGEWEYAGNNRITITLDGDAEPYYGVLSHQYNETLRDFTVTFTALSPDGPSIWGSMLP